MYLVLTLSAFITFVMSQKYLEIDTFLSSAPDATQRSYFGAGSGPIYMDNVVCDGDESFLTDCTHVSLHNCDHSEDAGVRCEGM